MLVVLVLAFVTFIVTFLSSYSHSEPVVQQYLVSSETVKVDEIENYYFFDGPGDDTAVIFYPGAKVEPKSYASLLYKLAENRRGLFFS